jgi:hypothetical protein
MQINNPLVKAILLLFPIVSFSQTTFIRSGGKEQWLLDRMEIKLQTNNDFNLSTVKPYLRNVYVRQGEIVDSMIAKGENVGNLSKTDQYNLDRFLANNSEFALHQKESWKSVHPWGKAFYQTKGNLIEVKDKDFYLSMNPAILQQQSVGDDKNGHPFINSKGITARGMIGKVGFDFYATDNQERGPLFEQQYVEDHKAVPGNGFYKPFKGSGQDYFDARGSVTWNITKYINMQFGYDKNFIGDGYRSLFLSDFSSNYLFLKFNTRIWKLNYTNLFMELTNQNSGPTGNVYLPKKYASMHHLSINATPWLNVGVFESVIFGREDHFDFTYLQPVIFLRSMESENGSPDNANIGFNFKANVAKKFQFYGQLMLDEFEINTLKKDPTSWRNKQAYQLGAKYVDAFGIQNLDLQLEYNSIRPFTFQHSDTVANYTHYNQPLADPLGANVKELIAIARYQPLKRLYLTGKIIAYTQGLDSAGINFGSNPLESYDAIMTNRQRSSGYPIGSGNKANCVNISFAASYEIKENLFIEATGLFRNYKTALPITNATMNNATNTNTNLISVGIRWNIARREYDY